jgi:hypothetical protein
VESVSVCLSLDDRDRSWFVGLSILLFINWNQLESNRLGLAGRFCRWLSGILRRFVEFELNSEPEDGITEDSVGFGGIHRG